MFSISSNIPARSSSNWRASTRVVPPEDDTADAAPGRAAAAATGAVPRDSPDALEEESDVGGETGAWPAELLLAMPESIDAAYLPFTKP